MKKGKGNFITHIVNVVTIALIVECFLCAMMLLRKYGRENSFTRIEEATQQVSSMFVHSLNETQNHLTVFADILAANASNPEDLLQTYMKNFCTTQSFTAVCIHRADGSTVSYGDHPHNEVTVPGFADEVKRLPYISGVYGAGDKPEDLFVYQAVPIIRGGKTIAVLYGYLPLSSFPGFISSSSFGGSGEIYIIDGDTGNFLLDEYHDSLRNAYDGLLPQHKTKDDYGMDVMWNDIRQGRSGYVVFFSEKTDQWYHTYYMPVGINNWSMQMTIDESTAFSSYIEVSWMLVMLAVCVIVLMVIHVLALMRQEKARNQRDRKNLHKSNYINSVQRALINAHRTTDFVGQALKLIADETKAETVLLLTLSDKIVTNTQYWPSTDKAQAMDLVGRNIRDDFPVLHDLLAAKESVVYDSNKPSFELSESGRSIFQALLARNMMIVPIVDNGGILKGVLSAVNIEGELKSCEMLECVTYAFFMALSNQESHAIIQRMGTIDYLTNVKNRNSFESELGSIAQLDSQNLWCVFVDVNGLHEVNNTQGHKAGDRMLMAVAHAIKNAFGEACTYRLGGDEFMAFAPDVTQQELNSRKARLLRELAAKGYHVSVGFAQAPKGADGEFDLNQAMEESERIMYSEKREFYQKNNLPEADARIPENRK